MSLTPLDLNDEQRIALMKFRRNTSDCILPLRADDLYRLQWLKARNFNYKEAEKMLRDSLKFRASIDADNLETKWTPTETFRRYYPSGSCGVDKDNVPVIILPFGRIDFCGLLQVATKLDFLKMSVLYFDRYLAAASLISRHLGRPSSAPQLYLIFDMDCFVLRRFTSPSVFDLIASFFRMFEANYPEVLKAAIVINASTFFSVGYALVRPFLHDNTARKITIFGTDKSKWQAALLENIDPDQLPVSFGGTLTGPDGDPRCPETIGYGGKVPTALYRKNARSDNKEWITALVKKNDKIQLGFPVSDLQKRWLLKWEVCSDKGAIQLTVYKNGPQNEMNTVLGPRHVFNYTKSSPHKGSYLCEETSIYIVEITNTSSSSDATVFHHISVVPDFSALVEDEN